MKHEEPKDLCVIIERSISTAKPPVESFEHMTLESKPTIAFQESKQKVSNVINFQEKCEAEINNTSYLK